MAIEIELTPSEVMDAAVARLKMLAESQQVAAGMQKLKFFDILPEEPYRQQTRKELIRRLEQTVSDFHNASTPMELLLADIARGEAALKLLIHVNYSTDRDLSNLPPYLRDRFFHAVARERY